MNGVDGVIWGDGVLLVGTDHPFGKDGLRRRRGHSGIGQVGMRYIWGALISGSTLVDTRVVQTITHRKGWDLGPGIGQVGMRYIWGDQW